MPDDGTLDISGLHIEGDGAELSLGDATVGGALRLVPRDPTSKAEFKLNGTADLTGLSVETLDDNIGRRWGKRTSIKMDHFTYRRTVGNPESGEFRQSSIRIVTDWLQARFAEIPWPVRLFPNIAKGGHFWRPWQLRRNWIYQQFDSFETRQAAALGYVSITRHRIREHQYSPQPFEQAIRVARAEGREDFAMHFDIHKQRLEWRFVNRGVRWPLGFAAIILSSLWLIFHPHSTLSAVLTIVALLMTLGLMVLGSWIRRAVRRRIVGTLLRSPGEWMPWTAAVLLLFTPWLNHDGDKAWVFAFLGALIAAIPLHRCWARWAAWRSQRPGRSAHKGRRQARRATSSKIATWFIDLDTAALLFAMTDWHQMAVSLFRGRGDLRRDPADGGRRPYDHALRLRLYAAADLRGHHPDRRLPGRLGRCRPGEAAGHVRHRRRTDGGAGGDRPTRQCRNERRPGRNRPLSPPRITNPPRTMTSRPCWREAKARPAARSFATFPARMRSASRSMPSMC